jgi:hypothetical protein
LNRSGIIPRFGADATFISQKQHVASRGASGCGRRDSLLTRDRKNALKIDSKRQPAQRSE